MGNNYVLSLQPTFTQGLILGQVSILFLLALILKYLFIDSTQTRIETSSFHPRLDVHNESGLRSHHKMEAGETDEEAEEKASDTESAEWFNMLLQQVRFVLLALILYQSLNSIRWSMSIGLSYAMTCQELKEMRSHDAR